MLEVALHNPRQHRQFRQGPEPLWLAMNGENVAIWTPADRRDDSSDGSIGITPQPDGVSLTILGCEATFDANQTRALAGTCNLPIPASFTIGDTRFEIALSDRASGRPLQTLNNRERALRSQKSGDAGPSPATLSKWFAALSSLNHWATSLQELYAQAARCAVEAIGLDGGIVLRRRDNAWEIAASHLPHPELGIHCDMAALDSLLTLPQTQFHGRSSDSPSREPAIVVSPLRNAAGELVGTLYGYRSVRAGNSRRTIRYLEANMIELLAGAVSEGIARIEREAEIERRRVLLEQAASATQNDRLRDTRAAQREVTLLFADLRDSTMLATMLQADETYELLGQVLEGLTAAVIDHDGLIIDYYGDGLAAMWNAPADQSDHAELACRAAVRMLEALRDISADWAEMLGRALQLGIGVHSGLAHVGNTGSRRRTKYGPRGTNVNLTSRIEAATRQIGLPFLATASAVSRLSNRFTAHRVCRARLAGLNQPTNLYHVCLASANEQSSMAWHTYERALQCFEDGRPEDAEKILEQMQADATEIPVRFLRAQVARDLSRHQRRRSSDKSSNNSRGVITLGAK